MAGNQIMHFFNQLHGSLKVLVVELENDFGLDLGENKHRQKAFKDRLAVACYISNIMYGNRTASSFELVRGYTPSVEGTGQKFLTQKFIDAYKAIEARRMIARIVKARPEAIQPDIEIGEKVLVLLPGGSRRRGHWEEHQVNEVRKDGSVVIEEGRKTRIIAREDVRKFPANRLASAVLKAQCGVLPRSSRKYKVTNEVTDIQHDESDEDSGYSLPQKQHSVQKKVLETKEDNDSQNSIIPSGTEEGAIQSGMDKDRCSSDKNKNTAIPEPYALRRSERIRKLNEDTDNENRELRRSTRISKPVSRFTMHSIPVVTAEDVAEAEQKILNNTYQVFRNVQFYCRDAPWIPRTMFAKAEKTEVDENWFKNISLVDVDKLPKNANVIGSHFVYKVKCEGTELSGLRFKLKARLCVHGNRDTEKDSLRTDAAVVSHDGFRMTYCIASQLGLIIGKGDISGAYPQSGEAKRKIFVFPPRCVGSKGKVWLLLATFYGIVTAGRKWQRASDSLLINNLGLEVIIGMPQLFRRANDGKIMIIVAKYVDDMLVAARTSMGLTKARGIIQQVFTIGHWVQTPNVLTMNSTEITQTPQDISICVPSLAKEIEPITLPAGRRKQISDDASQTEITKLRSIAGKLGYLGIACSPLASFAASYLQQCIPKLTVGTLKSLNGVIRDVSRRIHEVKYLQPSVAEQEKAFILAFSDAGYPHASMRSIAQEGCIVGIAFGEQAGSKFHTLTMVVS